MTNTNENNETKKDYLDIFEEDEFVTMDMETWENIILMQKKFFEFAQEYDKILSKRLNNDNPPFLSVLKETIKDLEKYETPDGIHTDNIVNVFFIYSFIFRNIEKIIKDLPIIDQELKKRETSNE